MAEPKRIQLSRFPGFRLQEHSKQLNGLYAVKVDRTTSYGNPWRIGEPIDTAMVKRWGWQISPEGKRHVCGCAKEAVAKFAHALLWDVAIHDSVRAKLGGKNLACWCKPDEFCHATPLLVIANSKKGDIDAIHAAIDKAIHEEAARILKEETS